MLFPLRTFVKSLPVLGPLATRISRKVTFGDSSAYWDFRYKEGGTSGQGSCGRLAEFKAEFLNDFVRQHHIESVMELGCGDGAQLKLAHYPSYTGLDISPQAIRLCRQIFAADPSKRFFEMKDAPTDSRADLALSLDVIYHLVEDGIFDRYMRRLFDSATKSVIIYSSNRDEATSKLHVRHRQFTGWVEANLPSWKLESFTPNAYPFDLIDPSHTSFADFYVFCPSSGVQPVTASSPYPQH